MKALRGGVAALRLTSPGGVLANHDFAAGMTGALVADLAQTQGLRVISRRPDFGPGQPLGVSVQEGTMKLSQTLKNVELLAVLLSLATFLYTQWQQAETTEAQTIASNRERLRGLIRELREDREENETEITIDIKTKHYATYADARTVMKDLPRREITPSQYLAMAHESWTIGARGFESLELAKEAVTYSEPGSIDQLSSLGQLGEYYFALARLYPDRREEFVPLGRKAYERMKQDWVASTDWRKGVIESEMEEYERQKQYWDKVLP